MAEINAQGWEVEKAGQSQLVIHAGGRMATREDLELAPMPESTKSWRPIPHLMFADGLKKALTARGHNVVRETFAMSKDGLKLFGLFDLGGGENGMGGACGFRNSNDKSVSLRAYAGQRVFVCDNLAISGQSVIMARKHTSRLDLDLEVGRGVMRWEVEMNRFRGVIRKLQEVEVKPEEAKKLIYRAFIEDEILPGRLARRVHDAHFGILRDEEEPLNEKFGEWGGDTAWRLNNAFTWAAQEMPMMARTKALQRVGQFFEAAIGAN
jgi:hypothetical protein